MNIPQIRAFMGSGIELEYAIVDAATLSCIPIADRLLSGISNDHPNEVRRGQLGWSNELALHVIEIKNLQPAAEFEYLPAAFQNEVRYMNRMLRAFGARLMPTAMHPWMNPHTDMRLWPHDNAGIYQAYARIFDVQTHGWANLQSMHINLPFIGDDEFARLHAAIRLILPIIPALAASSPIAEEKDTGFADFRMETYRGNAREFPSITGKVIPETISSRSEYEEQILAPMYREIRPFDPQGVLQQEWLNSRGAIARFDRNTIEIRVTDTQECPEADFTIAAAVISAVHMLYRARSTPLSAQQSHDTDALASIFLACVHEADEAIIDDREYLRLLGYSGKRCTAGDLWRHLARHMTMDRLSQPQAWRNRLLQVLEYGPLAHRIRRALGNDDSKPRLEAVYRQLCDCLNEGRMFHDFTASE